MKNTTLQHAMLLSLAALLMSCATSAPPPASRQGAPQSRSTSATISDILGIRLDMPRDTVRTDLARVARLEREERRRHEVWTLTNDPRFASLIIGYTPEWNVRFVTAVAKPDGIAVRYDQVLDVATAEHARREKRTPTRGKPEPPRISSSPSGRRSGSSICR